MTEATYHTRTHRRQNNYTAPLPFCPLHPDRLISLACYDLGRKEGKHCTALVFKNNCIYLFMLEKTLTSLLDSKETKPVTPKENQPWIFIGRTDAKAEAPILWPPDVKSRLIGKDLDAGKYWGQKKEVTDRGREGWVASSTQWTWVWANFRR